MKKETVLKKVFKHIGEHGWVDLEWEDVAKTQKIPLADIYAPFPTKMHLLEAFSHVIDHTTREQLAPFDADETPKDRLFSVIMTRFDALMPYKHALKRIYQDAWKDPLPFLCFVPQGFDVMSQVLKAAEFDTNGLVGMYRVKLFTGVYLALSNTWLQDGSPDMAATMAAIDQMLSKLEHAPSFF